MKYYQNFIIYQLGEWEDENNWFLKLCIWKLLRAPLIQFSKLNNVLGVCWFLGKNLSNFIYPIWKLHNPYCHSSYANIGISYLGNFTYMKVILTKKLTFSLLFTIQSSSLLKFLELWKQCNILNIRNSEGTCWIRKKKYSNPLSPSFLTQKLKILVHL